MAKLGEFDECFPDKWGFGDVDGIIEVNGKGLILEWKTMPSIPTGQRIMFERITRSGDLSVILVDGNPATMEARYSARYFKGNFRKWERSTLADVKARVRAWVSWARR